METETLIIGGGLSGLSLGSQLAAKGENFLIVEARERLGGRILTDRVAGSCFDLGPAWFWPGQPRIAALSEELNLTWFEQYAHGAHCFEDERGVVQRGRGFASMQGSYRLKGGLGALIERLSQAVKAEKICLNTPVNAAIRG